MAASACERGHKHFLVEPIKPCFFKVILDEASRVEKIAIPKKFVLKHGEKLADSVSFKIPDGATWKVKLIKTAGGIWLSKGWKEFAKHYSLNRGHLLVFEYNMNSSFQVRIFEPSATEMDYQKPNSDQSCQSQSLFDQCGCKRKRSDLDGQSESILKSHRRSEFHIAQPLTRKQRWEALRRASEGFNSENPVFMIAIQPAYLHGKLRVPFRFAKKYLQNITGEVTLQVNQGEPTTVAFILYPEYSHASFNNGWTTFQRENNLKVGDVLIFELIEETKALFNVTVSRATEVVNREAILDCKTEASGFETGNSARTSLRVDRDAEASNSVCKASVEDVCPKPSEEKFDRRFANGRVSVRAPQLTYMKKMEALQRAISGFKSHRPLVRVVMQLTYLHGNLRVNYQFAKEYLKEKSGEVILQVMGGQLRRKITFFVRDDLCLASFSAGWSIFARDNELKLGDAITFELIDETKLVFNVIISRAPEDL